MSYKLKSGKVLRQSLSPAEYRELFRHFFSSACKKTTSYKFALVSAILQSLPDGIQGPEGESIPYAVLFEHFTESLWESAVRRGQRQQAKNSKGNVSRAEQIFIAEVKKEPALSEKEFRELEAVMQKRLVQKIEKACKTYVLGALYGDFRGCLYAFDLEGDSILVPHAACEFLRKHTDELLRLNALHRELFLVEINMKFSKPGTVLEGWSAFEAARKMAEEPEIQQKK